MKSPADPPQKHHRKDDGDAFFPDPGEGPAVIEDDLAQELAEEYLIAATSGEEVAEDALNQDVPEDHGGPFVEDHTPEKIELEANRKEAIAKHAKPLAKPLVKKDKRRPLA